MIYCIAPQTSEDFEQYYQFRWQELRAPWHQPEGSEKDELEATSFHRMILDEKGAIAAVGRLHIDHDWVGHIRYVATKPACQGQGIGKHLMLSLEQIAAERGVKTVCLNARENALVFYQKLGYQQTAIAHKLYNEIQHFAMEKSLAILPDNQLTLIKSLQQVWHQTIPMSKAMGISTDYFDGQTFITHSDCLINKNLHNTMFAGSIYTLATLTGWGWVYLQLQHANLSGDIVLADGHIQYFKPIPQCASAMVIGKNVDGCVQDLDSRKKVKLTIEVGVYSGDVLAAKFIGQYVVKGSL